MKTGFVFLISLFVGVGLQAQSFFEEYKQDANKYVRNFTRPMFEANIYNFADGWGHSAQTLKPFHVQLDVMLNYSMIPDKYQNFVFDPGEYNHVDILDQSDNPVSNPVSLPTIFGGETDYKLRVTAPAGGGLQKEFIIDALPGVKDEFEKEVDFIRVGMPGVALQLNVGLPLGTELGVRYFPSTSFGPTQVSFLGLGVKHSLSQYFKSQKKSKLHLSALIAYSGGKIKGVYDNKNGAFSIHTYNLQVLGSYDMKFLSVYGGAGFIRGVSNFAIKGNYTYTYDIVDGGGNTIGTVSETVSDPLDMWFSANELKFHAGLQLNIYVVKIFVQYNIQKYPGIHAGISVKI